MENNDNALENTLEVSDQNTAATLLKRVYLFLEDGEWKTAKKYCKKVLDIDPENAEAYVCKLMADMRVEKLKDLQYCQKPIENNKNYMKALRLADDQLKAMLLSCTAGENIRKKSNVPVIAVAGAVVALVVIFCVILLTVIIPNNKYNDAVALMEAGKYTEAIAAFEEIDGHKDSREKIKACQAAYELVLLDGAYEDAVTLMNAGKYTEAIAAFEALGGHKDSLEQIDACNAFIMEENYNEAVALRSAGNVDEAYAIFAKLGDYKDAQEQATSISRTEKAKKALRSATPGSYIKFGSYEQDHNSANGKEDIEWLVLEVDEGYALLVSKYGLDQQPYHTTCDAVTWETCSLRKWLNNDFFNTAFFAEEQVFIPTATVYAGVNKETQVNPGRAVEDKVYILSIEEAKKYMGFDVARQCEPTDYAVSNGSLEFEKNGCTWWWLRAPGLDRCNAAVVMTYGNIVTNGVFVNTDCTSVRPVIWVKIDV